MPSIASEDFVQGLAKQISEKLPRLAKSTECPYRTEYKTKEWTWAVWKFWEEYRQAMTQRGPAAWELSPSERAAKGEYLVDFMLFEKEYGARIACESEWGMGPGGIQWDFEKLVGVKSDIKVLVHQCPFKGIEGGLKAAISDTAGAHISRGEAFLIIGFEKDKLREVRWWIPKRRGPFKAEQIHFSGAD